ncbi:hypothetical protein PTTG_08793, partial [Puccinia triticina 1-1 BBBD Race 1]
MASFLWLLMALTYSLPSAIQAQLPTAQPAPNPQQSNMLPRPMAQASSGQQQFLSQQQPTSRPGTMPPAGMVQESGAYPRTGVPSQTPPPQDASSIQESPAQFPPNNPAMVRNQTPPMSDAMGMNPPQTMAPPQTMMTSAQTMTPPQTMMTPPQTMMSPPQTMMDPAQTMTPSEKMMAPADKNQTKTPPMDFSSLIPFQKIPPMYSMKQASNTSLTPSPTGSTISPASSDQTKNNSPALNATMSAYNKKNATAKNQPSLATKNQTLPAPDSLSSIGATSLPSSANQTMASKANRKAPPTDMSPGLQMNSSMSPGQQMNSSMEISQAEMAGPGTGQVSPKAMKSAPIMGTSAPRIDTVTTPLPLAAETNDSTTPDFAQLIATEKFNGMIQVNAQDDLKAQELINRLRAASKMKLNSHQLGNQTVFLNSLTAEQKMILEGKMRSLALTPTQLQLEANYLGNFVSATDKMAHQAGFDAIKKYLTPEAQRGFDASEGMKSLILTDEQKYRYEEGSREFLEDPG